MAYQENKPQSTDTVSTSQSDLLGNFQAIKTLIDVNHATFGSATEGKHPIVHFPMLTVTAGSVPAATTTTEYALYSTTAGLWVRPPDKTAGTVKSDINFTESSKASVGWGRLACGVIIEWGTGSLAHNSASQAVAFPQTLTTCYCVQLSVSNLASGDSRDAIIAATSAGTTGFTATRKSDYKDSVIGFYWFAIGV